MRKLSINIVTCNSASTLQTCLTAIDGQTYRDFELCIFDNGSTDATLNQLNARLPIADITVVMHLTNIGYAAAHNQLINQTDSEYILTLNPDVALEPDYLAEVITVMDANSQVGSVAGCLLRVDQLTETPTKIDSIGLFMRPNRRQGLRFEGRPIADLPTTIESIFGPDGAAACYRRAMLEDIRLDGEVFDADFFIHKEDVDVCWRAQLRGWSSVVVPGAVGRHIRGFRPGQRQRVGSDLRFYGVRNRYLLMIKNEQPVHFFRNLVPILIYDIKILVYMVLFERASLRAFRSAWHLRRKMLTKRRLIQASRRSSWRELRRWFS